MLVSPFLRRLVQSNRGVAAIEFALGLPILCIAIFYGLETAWLALANQKVSQISAQTADNAARVRTTIDETDISQIMTAARLTGERQNYERNGRVIISSIQLNPKGTGQWIRWQRCWGGKVAVRSKYGIEGVGQNDGSIQGIGPKKLSVGAGMAVIVVETAYDYQPLISQGILGPKTLTSETAYVVRDRTDLGITNTTALPSDKRNLCA